MRRCWAHQELRVLWPGGQFLSAKLKLHRCLQILQTLAAQDHHTIITARSSRHNHHRAIITTQSSPQNHHRTIITAPSTAHDHHRTIITAPSSPQDHHCRIITAGSSPQDHYRTIITAGSSPQDHHRTIITAGSSPHDHHRTIFTAGSSPHDHHRTIISLVLFLKSPKGSFEMCGGEISYDTDRRPSHTPVITTGCLPAFISALCRFWTHTLVLRITI